MGIRDSHGKVGGPHFMFDFNFLRPSSRLVLNALPRLTRKNRRVQTGALARPSIFEGGAARYIRRLKAACCTFTPIDPTSNRARIEGF